MSCVESLTMLISWLIVYAKFVPTVRFLVPVPIVNVELLVVA